MKIIKGHFADSISKTAFQLVFHVSHILRWSLKGLQFYQKRLNKISGLQDSSTGVFLKILRNFLENLFMEHLGTTASDFP